MVQLAVSFILLLFLRVSSSTKFTHNYVLCLPISSNRVLITITTAILHNRRLSLRLIFYCAQIFFNFTIPLLNITQVATIFSFNINEPLYRDIIFYLQCNVLNISHPHNKNEPRVSIHEAGTKRLHQIMLYNYKTLLR